MVWLTERGVFALLRLDTDYFAAMYSYTITFGPFGPVTCNRCFIRPTISEELVNFW